MAVVAGTIASAGLGFGTARLVPPGEAQSDAHWVETAAGLRQSQTDLAEMLGELRSIKLAVEVVRGERERLRAELSSKQAQVSDRLERLATDSTARLGRLAEQVDRVEKVQRDPVRLQEVVDRLDHLDKRTQQIVDKVAVLPKPVAMAPVDVAQTGSLADPKSGAKAPEADPRKIPLEGYVLRDVADGFALVEGKNGRMTEMQAGQMLAPGNRVEAIERRGRQWVVVTAKGFITERWP